MKAEAGIFAALVLALTAACAVQPDPGGFTTGTAFDEGDRPHYLAESQWPKVVEILQRTPQNGDMRSDADWAMFRSTRRFETGTPEEKARWELARRDDSYEEEYLLKAFSCAVGAELTKQNAKTVGKIIRYVGNDASLATDEVKKRYQRERPFLHNPGTVCITKPTSFDYPSGHSTASWVEGLSLAEVAPDRATQILQRARAYGESRIVCGVHNWSAVEAGRTAGAAVYASLHASDVYRADILLAREEVRKARITHPVDAARCTAEEKLTAPLKPWASDPDLR